MIETKKSIEDRGKAMSPSRCATTDGGEGHRVEEGGRRVIISCILIATRSKIIGGRGARWGRGEEGGSRFDDDDDGDDDDDELYL